MKIEASPGRWYTRDHPHEIISPHVMRFDEIRDWLRELSTNPEWGWFPGGVWGLSRSLGMGPTSIKRKLTTGWIWPKEQVRLTARIRDIIEGRIVPRRFGRRCEGVWVEIPQPPTIRCKPKSIRLRAAVGARSILVAHDQKPAMQLPQFREAFQHVSFWDPDKKRAT